MMACCQVGAEAVGCMEVLYKDTVEYRKQREQFGQPIGKFSSAATSHGGYVHGT